jgi:hypothetical protein
MGYTYEDLPSGLQIIGRSWTESVLLEIAYGYEQATRYRKPPVTTPRLTPSRAGTATAEAGYRQVRRCGNFRYDDKKRSLRPQLAAYVLARVTG